MIEGKKVAVLATNGFENSELIEPVKALKEAQAEVCIVSLDTQPIRGVKGFEWCDEVEVNAAVKDVSAADFDALILPGGVYNPDILRTDEHAVRFVRDMFEAAKPIAAICHGPWLLIEAGVIKGRKATSYPSIRTDMINAGAQWVDEAVVVDEGLVTSRKPDDLEAFCSKLIEEIGEGRHEDREPAARAMNA